MQTANGGIPSTFFSAAYAQAVALNASLAALPANAATLVGTDGFLTLSGSDTALDVFSVTAAQLAGASWHGIDINAPAGATVIVNINGGGGAISADDLPLTLSGGVAASDVVYNLSAATLFNSINIGWLGSLLAPQVDYAGTFGNIDGDVVVASVVGSTEFHDLPFDGSLPDSGLLTQTPSGPQLFASSDPQPAPEPPSAALLAGLLAAFAVYRRRPAYRRRNVPTTPAGRK